MSDRTRKEIQKIVNGLDLPIGKFFLERLESDSDLTRDENPYTHFCVYFAAYDTDTREVFMGHHKKSGLWLFNGGHIDIGENPQEALEREIGEEWGLLMKTEEIGEPQFLTITDINNPTKQTCTKHYDVWYFVSVKKNSFTPDKDLLATEFHEARWMSTEAAREVVTDKITLEALSKFDEIFGGS